MKFKIFGRVITIYMKKKGSDFKFHFRVTKLQEPVFGINSNIDNKDVYEDGLHILLLDYDDELTLSELIEECKRLQEKFKNALGDAYIFESSPKKYHVHFYQAMPYWYALKIIHFSKVDDNYAKWRMRRDRMTLRLSPKDNGFVPKFVLKVPSKYPKPEIDFMKKEMASLLAYEIRIKNKDQTKGDKIIGKRA